MSREIVVSGIRPTGKLHLGNYLGALKNFVQMQHEHTCFFFIADLHSLTTHPTPAEFHENIKRVLVEYLACGIDPEVSTIYLQSDLPEIPELYLLLNNNAYKGELERVASFKEKARAQPDNVNAGLLTYPVLMTADVIIHKATKVPVGKDQEQHMEMARTFANRFNRLYKREVFPEPHAFNYGKELVKVPGLNAKGKMSKSEGDNTVINLADEPDLIRKKMGRAVTDSGPTEPNQPMTDGVKNLFHIMKLVSDEGTYAHFEEAYNGCTIRYGDLKKQIAEDVIRFTDPLRQRIEELYRDKAYLSKVVKQGCEKARESSGKTMAEVREAIGFGGF